MVRRGYGLRSDPKGTPMQKIKVAGTVVEMDGDAMTGIIWQLNQGELFHPADAN
jgi:isocitrate dehydrogenase